MTPRPNALPCGVSFFTRWGMAERMVAPASTAIIVIAAETSNLESLCLALAACAPGMPNSLFGTPRG
jgi:hypothetical protein